MGATWRMWEAIQSTERLALEPLGPKHIFEVHKLHNRDEVVAGYGGIPWSIQSASRRVQVARSNWLNRGFDKWAAYLLSNGEFVGRGGLSVLFVDGSWKVEVGWTLHPEYWGLGLATELGSLSLAFGIEQLRVPRVYSFARLENERSIAVMRRLGMEYARHIHWRGAPHILYSTSTLFETGP